MQFSGRPALQSGHFLLENQNVLTIFFHPRHWHNKMGNNRNLQGECCLSRV